MLGRLLLPFALIPLAACSCSDGRARQVRFWVGVGPSTSGTAINTTSKSCTTTFMGNLSKYMAAIGSLGFEMATMHSNGSSVFFQHKEEEATFGCMQKIKQDYPSMKMGVCAVADADPGSLATVASNPPSMAAAVSALKARYPVVDEFWTDFEVGYNSADQAVGINKGFALAQEVLPTFRYAGCEPRDPPYFHETCRQFATGAPGVIVQAANTYWSTTVSKGWYGGFEKLLEQEVTDIGADLVSQLSPAICPDCATGEDSDNTLSQEQLYERMDMVCARNITDISGFTFGEITGLHDGNNVGARYMEAFAYFRTGKKGLISSSMQNTKQPLMV